MAEQVNSYIAIDLETSGLQPKIDRIIEIGAWKVADGELTDSYHTLVNPHLTLSERIVELTGISGQMLTKAPGIEEVIESVIGFCGDLPLLGHHIIFDFSFLKRVAVNNNLKFKKEGIDTLKLCRKLMPETEKKNLEAACRYFGIQREGAHRALSDARDSHVLYQRLCEQYGEHYPDIFTAKQLIYKVKREQPATKKQKEDLRELIKYHKIEMLGEIDYLTRNEISRIADNIISQYGRIS